MASSFELRVGVNTGQVIVDDHAVGDPPNIAARVQAAGTANAVVITETTKQLLPPGAFDYEDLGVRELKNVGPLRLFRVLNRTEGRDLPVDLRKNRPFIGRKKQLDLLSEHWDHVKDGNGQVVIVSGEPGIGKTKLVQRFEALFGTQATTILRFNGSPFHRNTMLYPVIENIQFAARIIPPTVITRSFQSCVPSWDRSPTPRTCCLSPPGSSRFRGNRRASHRTAAVAAADSRRPDRDYPAVRQPRAHAARFRGCSLV